MHERGRSFYPQKHTHSFYTGSAVGYLSYHLLHFIEKVPRRR